MRHFIILSTAIAFTFLPGCGRSEAGDGAASQTYSKEKNAMQNHSERPQDSSDTPQGSSDKPMPAITDTAVFGGGCFWCIEAVYDRIEGVISVEAGYAGGTVENPTYEQVCSGSTGHAEVARIVFDPGKTSFTELLEVFWHAHDPTTMNRQGGDVGTQYRSAIFTMSDAQRKMAEESRQRIQSEFESPIVTEITPLVQFYAAENYHQDYYNRNRNAPYCQVVIRPKLKKLKLE
jgi:peptide-methionine (S)-S-oxide reductase